MSEQHTERKVGEHAVWQVPGGDSLSVTVVKPGNIRSKVVWRTSERSVASAWVATKDLTFFPADSKFLAI